MLEYAQVWDAAADAILEAYPDRDGVPGGSLTLEASRRLTAAYELAARYRGYVLQAEGLELLVSSMLDILLSESE